MKHLQDETKGDTLAFEQLFSVLSSVHTRPAPLIVIHFQMDRCGGHIRETHDSQRSQPPSLLIMNDDRSISV